MPPNPESLCVRLRAFVDHNAAFAARCRGDSLDGFYYDADGIADESGKIFLNAFFDRFVERGTRNDACDDLAIGFFRDLILKDAVHKAVHCSVEFEVVNTSLGKREIR